MAIPITRTTTNIVTTAFKKAGIPSPNSIQIANTIENHLEEIKNDIASRKDWKVLEETAVLIPTQWLGRYATPIDFRKALQLTIYDGDVIGTAQAGGSGTITLAANEIINEDTAKGSLIFITSGTSIGGMARITDYSSSTKIAAISPALATTADNTSVYMIPNSKRDLIQLPYESSEEIAIKGFPNGYMVFEQELYLSPIPDEVNYALKMRYGVDITDLDVTGTKHSRILKEWRTALVSGIAMRILEDLDDTTSQKEYGRFERAVKLLMGQDARDRRVRGQSYAKSLGGLPKSRR